MGRNKFIMFRLGEKETSDIEREREQGKSLSGAKQHRKETKMNYKRLLNQNNRKTNSVNFSSSSYTPFYLP